MDLVRRPYQKYTGTQVTYGEISVLKAIRHDACVDECEHGIIDVIPNECRLETYPQTGL